MTELLLDESLTPPLGYDPAEQRRRLAAQALDFTRQGTRPIETLGPLEDDPETYPFQHLDVAHVPFSDHLTYLDDDGNIAQRYLKTADLRRSGNLIVPRPYFELMVTEFARSPLIEDIAEGIPQGKDFVLLSNHDFFFDILLELEAIRCAVYDRFGKNEQLAALIAQQSASIVNKLTAWQEITLPLFGSYTHKDSEDAFELRPFSSAEVLSLVGSVFYTIADTESTVKAGIDPGLQHVANTKMLREIVTWRRNSHANGLGTLLVVAPSASVNKPDPNSEGIRNIGAGKQVTSLLKNKRKPIESVTEIGTVYDSNTGALSINIGVPHKPELDDPDTAIVRSMEEITRLSNERAAKLGASIIYKLQEK